MNSYSLTLYLTLFFSKSAFWIKLKIENEGNFYGEPKPVESLGVLCSLVFTIVYWLLKNDLN